MLGCAASQRNRGKFFAGFVFSIALCALALLTGCQSMRDTALAPLDARLEPVPGGGAKYLVLVNVSGKELHHFSLSGYLYNDEELNMFWRSRPTREFVGSCAQLTDGETFRMRPQGKGIEDPIFEHVSRLVIIGHCDEGHFRQTFQNSESGQLRRGVIAAAASVFSYASSESRRKA